MVMQTLVDKISGLYSGKLITELAGVKSGINHKSAATALTVTIAGVDDEALLTGRNQQPSSDAGHHRWGGIMIVRR